MHRVQLEALSVIQMFAFKAFNDSDETELNV